MRLEDNVNKENPWAGRKDHFPWAQDYNATPIVRKLPNGIDKPRDGAIIYEDGRKNFAYGIDENGKPFLDTYFGSEFNPSNWIWGAWYEDPSNAEVYPHLADDFDKGTEYDDGGPSIEDLDRWDDELGEAA